MFPKPGTLLHFRIKSHDLECGRFVHPGPCLTSVDLVSCALCDSILWGRPTDDRTLRAKCHLHVCSGSRLATTALLGNGIITFSVFH